MQIIPSDRSWHPHQAGRRQQSLKLEEQWAELLATDSRNGRLSTGLAGTVAVTAAAAMQTLDALTWQHSPQADVPA